MYILAIETTGAFASVALVREGEDKRREVIASLKGEDRFSHLQNLTPQIEQVMEEGKVTFEDIDAVAVSKGPGSFTGIRIGVSTARALAQFTGIKTIGVPTLEAFAMRGRELDSSLGESIGEDTLICPILDARRSQVYGAGYFIREGAPVEVVPGGSYLIDEFVAKVEEYPEIIFFGDGIDTCDEKIENLRKDGFLFAPESIRYQDGGAVGLLGIEMASKGEFCQYGELQPEYMRMAEAEKKLREKQMQKGE